MGQRWLGARERRESASADRHSTARSRRRSAGGKCKTQHRARGSANACIGIRLGPTAERCSNCPSRCDARAEPWSRGTGFRSAAPMIPDRSRQKRRRFSCARLRETQSGRKGGDDDHHFDANLWVRRRPAACHITPKRFVAPSTVAIISQWADAKRYASVCTITGPATAVAGPVSRGAKFCSIQASADRACAALIA